MFLFTTTTLVNSLTDYTTGKALITSDTTNKVVTIKRLGQYKKDDTHSICLYKAAGHNAYKDVIDLSGITGLTQGSTYRLALYIKSQNNADPMFSNDFVFKGRPVFVEFVAGTGDTETIKALIDNLNKYLNVVNDSAMLLPAAEINGTIDDTTSNVVGVKTAPSSTAAAKYIVAANEYMRITKAVVQSYVPATDTNKTDSWTDAKDLIADSKVATGAEGFGTYDQLEKDFRLPTAANLRWKRTMEDEMPIKGTLYTEYVLHYTVDRGQVGGMGAVGQKVTSETTHVFWVAESQVSDFEDYFTGIADIIDTDD